MAPKPTERVLTLEDFDRFLQDSEVMAGFMEAIATGLRARYGKEWLLRFSLPDGLTESDRQEVLDCILDHAVTLVDKGQLPSIASVVEAATLWVQRLVKSRADQWARLGEATDKAAASYSSHLGVTNGANPGSDLFLNPENRAQVAEEVTRQIHSFLGVERMAATEEEIAVLAAGLVKENLGAGALEEFLDDMTLSEIMVGAGGHVWVERDGVLIDTGKSIPEKRALWFAQRLAATIGSRIDTSEPSMDGFLPDGSRVHIIISPVAMDGVSITIRRHAKRPTLEQLIAWGAITPELADFLKTTVVGRANILISGGTSSGKTSLLNAVGCFIPSEERIVTMEDSPELRLPMPHVIRLRTRRANIEGRGEITMRQLVKESLRMRPDRIVVGEVRSAEALDMVEALNTGHDGGLSTAHANSPIDMLKRLGQMMKRGDSTLTDSGAYELIASSIHLIVHAERRIVNGVVTRGVEEVVEILDYDPSRPGTSGFTVRTLFNRENPERELRLVNPISDKLATHLWLNGEDVSRWRW